MRHAGWLMGAAALCLVGCGKEAGRLPLSAPGSADATMTLAAGDVSFWTDVDVEWEGDAAMHYQVKLLQGGAVVGTATCDPLARLSVKTSWVETNVGSHHSRSGNGKLGCSVKLASGGPTAVHADLVVTTKPTSMTPRKADLVVKQ